MLLAIVSAFLSLLAYTNVCAERHACLKAGTCFAASNSSFSCGFARASPPPEEDANASDQQAALASMTRGVCMPGLQQNVDPVTGSWITTTPKLPGRAEHGYCRRRRTHRRTRRPDCQITVGGAAAGLTRRSIWAKSGRSSTSPTWRGMSRTLSCQGRVGSSDVAKFAPRADPW